MRRILSSLVVLGLVCIGMSIAVPALAACAGVNVAPGTGTLEAALTANAAGTTFCLTSSTGTYTVAATLSVQTGDIITGPSAGGAKVVASSGVSPFNNQAADTVQLSKLRISGTDSTGSYGIWTGSGWTITTVEVSHFEFGVKLGFQESGNTLTGAVGAHSKVHDNTRYGVIAPESDAITVAFTDVYANNTAQHLDFDAGGTKFAVTDGLSFHDNQVYSNWGNGVWLDVDATNSSITGNIVHDQIGLSNGDGEGIRDETSCLNTVSGNTVYGNDQGGIDVVSSGGSIVSGNTVTASTGDDFAIQVNADGRAGCGSTATSSTLSGNDVTTSGGALAASEAGTASLLTATWTADTYHGGCTSALWDPISGAATTFVGWQNTGRDLTGSCT